MPEKKKDEKEKRPGSLTPEQRAEWADQIAADLAGATDDEEPGEEDED